MSTEPLAQEKRRKPRRTVDAYAACGSHGKPWCHMMGPRAKPGQLAVFETFNQAVNAHGGKIHRVKIYIDAEPCNGV
jgi:hypothetical protein